MLNAGFGGSGSFTMTMFPGPKVQEVPPPCTVYYYVCVVMRGAHLSFSVRTYQL